MGKLKIIPVVSCLILLTVFFPSGARTDDYNKRTIITVNEPFEIPGMVLPAGKYVLKLMNLMGDRNVVQIFNEQESHVYATILAVPSYRMDPTGKTEITFWERAENAPPAIRTWFYPGDQYGEEFVYHKPKALEIAKRVNQPVLAMPAATGPNLAELKKAPLVAVKPNAQEVQVAQVMTKPTPSAVPQVALAKPQKHMPRTASEFPLVALIGLLSLGTATGLTALNRHLNAKQ
jgi:hypothetical protein